MIAYTDQALLELVSKGKQQGYLTYEEVGAYLPDEDVSPAKLDDLLLALDELGIELVEQPPVDKFEDRARSTVEKPAEAKAESGLTEEPLSAAEIRKLTGDPIRMYLMQMSKIPLLTREQEIALAKKIEITRKRFRRSILSCDFALRATIDTLKKVYRGELPFDRTIKVSLTERLTKEQILARMPHNLATLETLLERNSANFNLLISKSTPADVRAKARCEFLRGRRKCLQLVEELSLRTRRVHPLMNQLEEFSQRMDDLRRRLNELAAEGGPGAERTRLRKELARIMNLVQESPTSLRNRCVQLRQQYQQYEEVKRQLSERKPAASGVDRQESTATVA